jgi:hypothetical protein
MEICESSRCVTERERERERETTVRRLEDLNGGGEKNLVASQDKKRSPNK